MGEIFVYIPKDGNVRDVKIKIEKINQEGFCLENGDVIDLINESIIVKRFPLGEKAKKFWFTFELVTEILTEEEDWAPIINPEFRINGSYITNNSGTSFRFRTMQDEDFNRYWTEDRNSQKKENDNEGLVLEQHPCLRRLFWLIMGNLLIQKLTDNQNTEDPKI